MFWAVLLMLGACLAGPVVPMTPYPSLPPFQHTQQTAVAQLGAGSLVPYYAPDPSAVYSHYTPELYDVFLSATLDGSLHGINKTSGSVLWTIPSSEPLIDMSTSSNNTDDVIWIVEPVNEGALFYFDAGGLHRLPLTIKQLVADSPFALLDRVYTGYKHTVLYSIDAKTGKILKKYGESTEKYDEDDICLDTDSVMIGKTVYTLSIHSNSRPAWNVRYTVWGPDYTSPTASPSPSPSPPRSPRDSPRTRRPASRPKHPKSGIRDRVIMSPYANSIQAINNKGFAWEVQLKSTPIEIFDILDLQLSRENLLMSREKELVIQSHPLVVNNFPDNSKTFINKTDWQSWYALSSINFPSLISQSSKAKWYELLDAGLSSENLQELWTKFDDGMIEDIIVGVHEEIPFAGYFGDIMSANQGFPGEFDHPYRIGSIYPYYGHPSSFEKDEDQKLENPNFRFNPGDAPALLPPGSEDSQNSHNTAQSFPIRKNPYYHPNYQNTNTQGISNNHIIITEKSNNYSYIYDFIFIILVLFMQSNFGTIREYGLKMFKIIWKFIEDLYFKKLNKKDLKEEEIIVDISKLSNDDKINGKKSNKIGKKNENENGSENENKGIENDQNKIENDKLNNIKSDSIEDESEIQNKKVNDISHRRTDSNLSDSTDQSQEMDTSQISEKPNSPNNNDNSITSNNSEPGQKKRRKRGTRGGKKNAAAKAKATSLNNSQSLNVNENSIIPVNTPTPIESQPIITEIGKLRFTNERLGYSGGTFGTSVFKGTFDSSRAVAVKRVLLEFFDTASNEIDLLLESDFHTNIARYYCKERDNTFMYIALELFDCTLYDFIKHKEGYKSIEKVLNGKSLLEQMASGLKHLHSLKIVHGDINPQNVLVVVKQSPTPKARIMISDLGLCKRLENDESSYTDETRDAVISGWRAPELLTDENNGVYNNHILPSPSDDIKSATTTVNLLDNASTSQPSKGLTKAIDIFSIGCLFYYFITEGEHPFGNRYVRDGNIIENRYSLNRLENFEEEGNCEALDLVSSMISNDPTARPEASEVLRHPYFWSNSRKLDFLLKFSDKLDAEDQDLKNPSRLVQMVESGAHGIVGNDWFSKLDKQLIDNLGKYRTYRVERLNDLLRALRNKGHHYNDLPPDVKTELGSYPSEFYSYFERRFPKLLMYVYNIVKAELRDESVFKEYFED